MKKITFICPNLKSGAGIERITSILINQFVASGCEVQLILLWENLVEFSLPDTVDVTFMGFDSSKKISYACRHIKELIKSIQGDIIYSLMNPASDIAILAGLLSRKKVIVAERNDPKSFPFRKINRVIRNISYNFAHRIVFQTEDQKNYFSPIVQKKGVIIRNPIRENMPKPFRGKRNHHIVASGRLDTQKNLPLLFESYSRIAEEYQDYDLYLYGKGTREQELCELAQQMGLSERIHFEGFKKNIDEIIRDSAMYVSSSDYEGICNSMIEAMSMGIPTICTDCPIGGARAMITDGINGLLVPVRDSEKLYKAMKTFIDRPEYAARLGAKAEEIRNMYPVEKIAKEWLALAD